jgi:hypothetical protein
MSSSSASSNIVKYRTRVNRIKLKDESFLSPIQLRSIASKDQSINKEDRQAREHHVNFCRWLPNPYTYNSSRSAPLHKQNPCPHTTKKTPRLFAGKE